MAKSSEQRQDPPALPQATQVDGFSSYPPEEVTFLVKNLSTSLVEVSRAEYEQRTRQSTHYAEMLPEEEYRPTAEALTLFEHSQTRSATARARRGSHDRERALM